MELELDVSNKLLVFLNVALWYVKKSSYFRDGSLIHEVTKAHICDFLLNILSKEEKSDR